MQEILKNILENKEAKTYLATLELGTPTISRISKKTGIPRSSTYLILDELEKKGLITRSSRDGKSQIIPAFPEKLDQILDQKINSISKYKDKLNQILPELKALHQKSTKKPKVQYFEGILNIRSLILQMIEEAKDSSYLNLCQGYSKKHGGLIEDPEYIKEAVSLIRKYDIQAKEIIEDMQSARQYQKKMKDTKVEILLAPQVKSEETTHIDKYIWKDKIVFLNSEIDYAVLIEDKYIAENERLSFNVLWNTLKDGHYKY
jgi:sugar-specific transcriptional regulator TrmB